MQCVQVIVEICVSILCSAPGGGGGGVTCHMAGYAPMAPPPPIVQRVCFSDIRHRLHLSFYKGGGLIFHCNLEVQVTKMLEAY